jgi:TolB-like protein/Flp pilus assembly protein TadD
MSSIIEGYNYDIFISYRQKDNKHDGWVTEFVNNLKGELESTFKEEITVYFDINPHDGLLETHDVDASLKDKLKCLIFIPIISRTYCDPKSFAWEHEFKAFVELASKDQFGLKVKLPNGNVASRILPIQIHDLHPEDKSLFETELGGVLRAIEFIYKEPGVNKPLNADDDEKKNLNGTKYRIQINKVSNAIDEIIHSLKGKQTAHTDGRLLHEQPFRQIGKEQGRESSGLILSKNNSKRWFAMLAAALVCIVAAFALFKFTGASKHADDITKLEKSIAVLPFINESPVDSNKYFINGIMEEVLNNLQSIKDFRVLSRTSTDQYKDPDRPTITEIAKKLNVNYVVEGSGQKYGNKFRLSVQLIRAKGKETHLWGKSYEQEISETKDIFIIQSQIAEAIATELKASIVPEEKQLIEKASTSNLTAYDFYTRGKEELGKYWSDNKNKLSLIKAEDLYHKALENDSTFAPAYVGLAQIYWNRHHWSEILLENFMDSVLILCNRALSFDNKLSEAYTLKGSYYSEVGKPEEAIEEYNKAIKLNPNDWEAYWNKGYYYSWINLDLVKSINYLQKAVSLNRGPELPKLLSEVGFAYFCAGFPEKAKYYYQEKLKLDDDSSAYYSSLSDFESNLANFNKSIEFGIKVYAIDSTNEHILYLLGFNYACLGQFEKSLKYYKKFIERRKTQGGPLDMASNVGYAYWQNGSKEEAEYYLNEQLSLANKVNELKRSGTQNRTSYYDLAAIYAFRGEKDEAFKNLRVFNQIQRFPLWWAILIKIDPLFNSIRNEPEYQQIVRDVEAKYQAEHERVRKWLEEQGKL